MQLSILPVKEYNESKDSKEKVQAASASFLAYLQDTQINNEKKKEEELKSFAIPAAASIALPMKTEQLSTEVVTASAAKEFGLQTPLLNQAAANGLHIALDLVQNMEKQSPVMIPKGTAIENKQGNPSSVEKSLGFPLQSQVIKPIAGTNETLQQVANPTFQQVSQQVAMDHTTNQEIGMKVLKSGMMNSLLPNEAILRKPLSNQENVGILLPNQVVSGDFVATTPLGIGTIVPKMGQESRKESGGNSEKVSPAPLSELKVDAANQLKILIQSGQGKSHSNENRDNTNDSNPKKDKAVISGDVASSSILTANSQVVKSFDATLSSVPTTVSRLAQDMITTFSPRIHVSGTPEKMEATLSLKPENLGNVDVQVVIQDGHVRARLIADSFIGRTTLEQHVDSLYAALQQQGFQVDKIHITQHPSSSLSSAFSQGGDSAPKQGQQQSKRRGDSYSETEEYSDAPYESEWVSQINTMA